MAIGQHARLHPSPNTARLFPMPMQSSREAAARLLAIDELQDDLLRQLDELERRTEAVLTEFLPVAPGNAVSAPKTVAVSHPRIREAA